MDSIIMNPIHRLKTSACEDVKTVFSKCFDLSNEMRSNAPRTTAPLMISSNNKYPAVLGPHPKIPAIISIGQNNLGLCVRNINMANDISSNIRPPQVRTFDQESRRVGSTLPI